MFLVGDRVEKSVIHQIKNVTSLTSQVEEIVTILGKQKQQIKLC